MVGEEGSAYQSKSEPVLGRREVESAATRSASVPAVLLSQPFREEAPLLHEIRSFQADTAHEEPGLCVSTPLRHAELASLQPLLLHQEEVVQYLARKLDVYKGESPRTEVLLALLREGVRFAGELSLGEWQVVVLLNILYKTQQFFLASEWRTAQETYAFLKETLLLHTVQRPPWSVEVFQPLESQRLLDHVARHYIRHLPLVHMCSLPVHVVQLGWTPEPRAELEQATPATGASSPQSPVPTPDARL